MRILIDASAIPGAPASKFWLGVHASGAGQPANSVAIDTVGDMLTAVAKRLKRADYEALEAYLGEGLLLNDDTVTDLLQEGDTVLVRVTTAPSVAAVVAPMPVSGAPVESGSGVHATANSNGATTGVHPPQSAVVSAAADPPAAAANKPASAAGGKRMGHSLANKLFAKQRQIAASSTPASSDAQATSVPAEALSVPAAAAKRQRAASSDTSSSSESDSSSSDSESEAEMVRKKGKIAGGIVGAQIEGSARTAAAQAGSGRTSAFDTIKAAPVAASGQKASQVEVSEQAKSYKKTRRGTRAGKKHKKRKDEASAPVAVGATSDVSTAVPPEHAGDASRQLPEGAGAAAAPKEAHLTDKTSVAVAVARPEPPAQAAAATAVPASSSTPTAAGGGKTRDGSEQAHIPSQQQPKQQHVVYQPHSPVNPTSPVHGGSSDGCSTKAGGVTFGGAGRSGSACGIPATRLSKANATGSKPKSDPPTSSAIARGVNKPDADDADADDSADMMAMMLGLPAAFGGQKRRWSHGGGNDGGDDEHGDNDDNDAPKRRSHRSNGAIENGNSSYSRQHYEYGQQQHQQPLWRRKNSLDGYEVITAPTAESFASGANAFPVASVAPVAAIDARQQLMASQQVDAAASSLTAAAEVTAAASAAGNGDATAATSALAATAAANSGRDAPGKGAGTNRRQKAARRLMSVGGLFKSLSTGSQPNALTPASSAGAGAAAAAASPT